MVQRCMHRLLKVIYNYIVSQAYIQKERKKEKSKTRKKNFIFQVLFLSLVLTIPDLCRKAFLFIVTMAEIENPYNRMKTYDSIFHEYWIFYIYLFYSNRSFFGMCFSNSFPYATSNLICILAQICLRVFIQKR